MVDVINKRCGHLECTAMTFVDMAGSTKAETCGKHAKERMTNVITKRCGEEGCTKVPSFGTAGRKENVDFCSEHAKEGMNNVARKRCDHPECSFGIDGTKKVEFCSEHATKDMVNLQGRRCGRSGCTKFLSFGVEGKTAGFCSTHINAGMLDVKNKR